jgi:prepilin-type N-terminal cleavage/methylation domain-containing protein
MDFSIPRKGINMLFESLSKLKARRETGEGGFTLVELLIVIVILGILAAIVVLAIGGLKSTSQKAACSSGVKTIESAEDAFFAVSENTTVTPAIPAHYGTIDDLLNTAGPAGKVLKKDPRPGLTVPDGGVTATANYSIVGSGSCSSVGTVPEP